MTADQLWGRLRAVEDPELGVDIVSLGLVTDVHVTDGTAAISLAFNAPLSPAEWTMCDEVRALCRGVGLEPRIYADADDRRDPFPGVKNAIAIGTTDPDARTGLVTANLAMGLASLGARVGVIDCRIDESGETWLETADPPDLSADPIVPPTVREVPVVRLGPAIPDGDDPPSGETVFELVFPPILEALEWGPLDYLLATLPEGTDRIPRVVVEAAPIDGTIAVASADADPTAVRTMIETFDTLESSMLGVLGTVDGLSSGSDGRASGHEWWVDRPGPVSGCPPLGIVPCDRSTLATPADLSRCTGPDAARASGDDRSPFRRLAVSVADRVGAVNRQGVAQRQRA
ncbi:Mrp/NBP35 family ATP-binding protein [Halosolutus halophilus]|uniref:Mrp/NBP35 family ATP-binding protein n=1 Tax=Halosolutus halophilus TaxID=1552990 RepID=UPI002234F593|nr:Mrp/NBP35 family ATP-binding protein [Halosolutus halophilus]